MAKSIIIIFLTVLFSSIGYAQIPSDRNFKLVGTPCECCEAIFEYGERNLTYLDTLPDFHDAGLKIKVSIT